MENITAAFTASLAFENDILPSVATRVVAWLETEGALDYDVLRETYIGETEGVRE